MSKSNMSSSSEPKSRRSIWQLAFQISVLLAATALAVMYLIQIQINGQNKEVVETLQTQLEDMKKLKQQRADAEGTIIELRTSEDRKREQILKACQLTKAIGDFPITSGNLFVVQVRDLMFDGGATLYVPPGNHELDLKIGLTKTDKKTHSKNFIGKTFERTIRLPENSVVRWRYTTEIPGDNQINVTVNMVDAVGNVYLDHEAIQFPGQVSSGGGTGSGPMRVVFRPNEFMEYQASSYGNTPKFGEQTGLRMPKPQWQSNGDLKKQEIGNYLSFHWEIRSANQPSFPARARYMIPARKRCGQDIVQKVRSTPPGVLTASPEGK